MLIPSPRMAAVRAILDFALLLVSPATVQAQTSIYQFDPSNNLLGTITAPGRVTAMTYDSQINNLVVDSDLGGTCTFAICRAGVCWRKTKNFRSLHGSTITGTW